MSGWLISEKAAEHMLDTILQIFGRETADAFEVLLATDGSPVVESVVQWCWFYGGDSPDEAAGMRCEDDEGRATAMPQWLVDGGTAWRPVAFGPWLVQPRETPDHPLPTAKET